VGWIALSLYCLVHFEYRWCSWYREQLCARLPSRPIKGASTLTLFGWCCRAMGIWFAASFLSVVEVTLTLFVCRRRDLLHRL